jgi:hypothetical protein
MNAYFCRGCKDGTLKLFSCDITITPNFVEVRLKKPIHKFGMNDNVFTDCEKFIIYFNTIYKQGEGFFTFKDSFNFQGLTTRNNVNYFADGFTFYLKREDIHENWDMEMGN